MRPVLVIVATVVALAATLAAAPPAAAEGVVWQQVFDGRLHGGDAFTALATAPDGGVFAAGYAAVSSTNRSDMLLVRYASSGARSWVRQWNGPASGSDQCWDLARDGRGGLYLVGRTAGRGGDAAILRYSLDGRLTWSRRFGAGSGWQDDARLARGVTGGDGIYVVVESWSGTAYRTRVLRYTGKGTRLWTASISPGTRVSDAATDAGDGLFLCGWATTATGSAAALDCLSPSGALRWSVRLPGDAAFARATSMSTVPSGIVWTSDVSDAAGAPSHGSVSASSYVPFAQRWGGDLGLVPPYSLSDVGGTGSGGAVAVGRDRSGGADRGFVVRLDPAGAVVTAPLAWTDAAGCGGDLVAVTSGDAAWVAGRTGTVFSALHHVPASGLAWRYDYDARPAGRALALTAASDGGAYVAGWGRATGAGADALILRLTP